MTDREFEKLLDEVAGERAEEIEQKPDPRHTERCNGATINGGAYSIAYYYDEQGNPCHKDMAATVNIVEYSDNGERINENYGRLKQSQRYLNYSANNTCGHIGKT